MLKHIKSALARLTARARWPAPPRYGVEITRIEPPFVQTSSGIPVYLFDPRETT